MKPYLALLSARLRIHLQYRAAAVAGAGTQLFWGIIRMMIFEAFYLSSNAVQPISQSDVVSYIWLSQAFLLLLPWWMDTEIRTMITSGTVAYELLRPTDMYWFWFLRGLASRFVPLLLRCLPILILAMLFFGLRPPPNLYAGLLALISLILALLLSTAIITLLHISLIHTTGSDGINRLVSALSLAFSGILIPIPLLPSWIQPLFDWSLFTGLMDHPFRIYMGHIPYQEAMYPLLRQVLWCVVLILWGRRLLNSAMRKLVVQGG